MDGSADFLVSSSDVPTDILRHYRGKNANATHVSLQFYEIEDLVPLMAELSHLPNMFSFSLAHNRLTSLPEDMSSLHKLETLDLTENPITEAAAVLNGLFSLQNLKHLSITLPEHEEDRLVATLSSLETLNGVLLDEGAEEVPEEDQIPPEALTPPRTKRDLLNSTSPSMPREEGSHEPPRGSPPEKHQPRYKNVPPPKVTHTYKPWTTADPARFKRINDLVGKTAGTAHQPDGYEDFQTVVLTHLRSHVKSEGDSIKKEVHQFNAGSLLLEYSFDELARVSSRYGVELRDAVVAIFEEYVLLARQASSMMAALQEDRDRKIAALQEDLARELLAKERSRMRFDRMPTMNEFMDDAKRALLAAKGGGLEDDAFPLEKLTDLMELVTESKRQHDEANLSAQLPKETLEQHVYTFYYNRASSDQEIKRFALQLFTSVKRWCSTDTAAEVFRLILRNELPESYWYTHKTLTNTLFDNVHVEVARLGRQSEDPSVFTGTVDEDTCRRVIDTVFPHRDNSALLSTVLNATQRAVTDEFRDFQAPRVIGYREFVQIVLRANLAMVLLTIAPISREFRSHDPHRSGVIDAPQFRLMLGALMPEIAGDRVDQALQTLDPHTNNVLTFSDVVQFVAPALRHKPAYQPAYQRASSPQQRRRVQLPKGY